MTNEAFWEIVDAAKAESGDAMDQRVRALAVRLEQLPPAEIVEFDRIFHEQRARAYTWDLWAAAYIMGGGCSDDGFIDFRNWLISLGRPTFEAALCDPETLAAVPMKPEPQGEDDFFFEEYGYIARDVYTRLTGTDLPDYEITHPDQPVGEPWEEDELPDRLPALWAKYGEDW